MSDLKLCQGPRCHTYNTKDRLKGVETFAINDVYMIGLRNTLNKD